jgi:hypothetical protein
MNRRLERTELPSLPATAQSHGLGNHPLGSAQSRAAARSLVAAREDAEEEGGVRFQCVSILDGKPIDWDAPPEPTKATKKKKGPKN